MVPICGVYHDDTWVVHDVVPGAAELAHASPSTAWPPSWVGGLSRPLAGLSE